MTVRFIANGLCGEVPRMLVAGSARLPAFACVVIAIASLVGCSESRSGWSSSTELDADGAGVIRIQFPESDGPNELEPIAWDDFFAKFDENELAFLYQETTSEGQISRFNRLVNI